VAFCPQAAVTNENGGDTKIMQIDAGDTAQSDSDIFSDWICWSKTLDDVANLGQFWAHFWVPFPMWVLYPQNWFAL